MVESTICSGCGNATESTLTCPICKKIGNTVFFCSQECFKTVWIEHCELHSQHETASTKMSERCDGSDNHPYLKKFRGFRYTGELRAWPITPRKKVPDHIAKPDYALSGVPESEMNLKNSGSIKENSPQQIKLIRRACSLGRKALDLANSLIRPGITTDEIDSKVHDFIVLHSGYPSPLNYFGFPKSCCTSVNEVICHGIPDLRPLEEGDIVNVDISVYLNGAHGDLNETFFVGEVDEDSLRLTKGTYFTLMKTIERCRPGMYYREIGNLLNDFADKYGLSVVRTYCGHGVGTDFHSLPNIPHYRKNKAVGILKPNHVFTIEPMLNLGSYRDVKWPDDWTAATIDGKRSAQFEHTLLVTNSGVEILTKRTPTSPPLGFDTEHE